MSLILATQKEVFGSGIYSKDVKSVFINTKENMPYKWWSKWTKGNKTTPFHVLQNENLFICNILLFYDNFCALDKLNHGSHS